MRFSLRQLQVFVTTARHRNLSRAARELAMSQSAASASLAELEQHYGVQLFDRIGKRLQLNAQGQWLRPRAEALLDQARALDAGLAGTPGGQLKVGATLTIGNYLAVPLVARFMADYPDCQVQLDVENTAEISRKVREFELDLGLVEGELSDPALEVEHWCDDRLTVFCAPGHPLAAQGTLSDEDLARASWILRESGSGTRQTFDRAMHGLLPGLRIALELQHTEAIKRAVEAGLGVGCLSQVTLEEAFRRGSLVPLATPQRDFSRSFYFILQRQKYRTATLERWLDLCREHRQPAQ